VQGLALKPRNADLLFYKAWAYKVRPHNHSMAYHAAAAQRCAVVAETWLSA
jgi:hypothetical protein